MSTAPVPPARPSQAQQAHAPRSRSALPVILVLLLVLVGGGGTAAYFVFFSKAPATDTPVVTDDVTENEAGKAEEVKTPEPPPASTEEPSSPLELPAGATAIGAAIDSAKETVKEGVDTAVTAAEEKKEEVIAAAEEKKEEVVAAATDAVKEATEEVKGAAEGFVGEVSETLLGSGDPKPIGNGGVDSTGSDPQASATDPVKTRVPVPPIKVPEAIPWPGLGGPKATPPDEAEKPAPPPAEVKPDPVEPGKTELEGPAKSEHEPPAKIEPDPSAEPAATTPPAPDPPKESTPPATEGSDPVVSTEPPKTPETFEEPAKSEPEPPEVETPPPPVVTDTPPPETPPTAPEVKEPEKAAPAVPPERLAPDGRALPSCLLRGGKNKSEIVHVEDASMVFLFVPGGSYKVGADSPQGNERAVREVTLTPFFISRTEVTNGQYRTFLRAAIAANDLARFGHPNRPSEKNGVSDPAAYHVPGIKEDPELEWSDGSVPDSRLRLPACAVDFWDAWAFAQWAGGSLPSEVQWEVAAGYADGGARHIYPWGDTFSADNCKTILDIESRADSHEIRDAWMDSNPPGQRPTDRIQRAGSMSAGASKLGIVDLSGSVAEWCLDAFEVPADANQLAADPVFMGDLGSNRALRGGSWHSLPDEVKVTSRTGAPPTYRGDDVGIRVVIPHP